MTDITAKNFTRKLSAWKRGANTMRDNAQAILDFGFDVYLNHGDAGYLSRMIVAARETKGINAGRMESYVTAYANVRWNDEKNSFAKKSKKEDPTVEERLSTWYEHEKPVDETPKPLDVNKRLESLLKAINEADSLKISVAEAREALSKISAEIDTVELQILEAAAEDQAA